jgi:hypothetical protein
MNEFTGDARVYLLEAGENQVPAGAPALIGPDGTREEIPPLVYRAVQHVVEAMRAGMGVKVSPLRAELPIDEAAHAIAMHPSDLREHIADGDIPFRSTEFVDWVKLSDVLALDRAEEERRRAAMRDLGEALDEERRIVGDQDDESTNP